MNIKDKDKEKSNNSKLENIVNQFIKQILELDSSTKTLEDKLNSIDNLINNLIDFCIKKKIFYYVENKIGYNNIITNFKTHLIKFIKNLVDPSNSIISKYVTNNTNNNFNSNWDNVSDINSLMFKNFKKLNESFEKNVSFNQEIDTVNYNITNYDECEDGFEINSKSNINNNLMKFSEIIDEENNHEKEINNLSLYIKILVNQNKFLVEFIDKLIYMCKILSDNEVKYKKLNPYD
jgi:hypothetical protein